MKKERLKNIFLVTSIFFGVILFLLIFSSFPSEVTGYINETVTVITQMNVGTVSPEILNVSIMDNAADFDLTANATTYLECIGILRDFNGEGDLKNASAEFFDNSASSYGGSDDNNTHYTNNSCNITLSFGTWHEHTDDAYMALANCSFNIQYYANPTTWNCTIKVYDNDSFSDIESDTITITELLSIGLPDTLNYGTVNATNVSEEKNVTVTNYGNVMINLSLSGYAVTPGDNFSMNCSLGTIKNISINYERYNLTASNTSIMNLAEYQISYTNLTSSPLTRKFDLNYRQNDSFNEAFNNTYWRMYVPLGVAGSCSGNIEVSAVMDAES